MTKHNITDRLASGPVSRRSLLRSLAAVGVGVTIMPAIPRRATAAGKQANLFTWSGYEIPELHGAYKEKHGSYPDFSIFADEDEAFQKMRAGFTPDVMHPCTYNVGRWRDADLLQPIDTSRLSNWGDVISSLKTLEGTQEDGKQWFIPFDWGNTSILYRTDLVDLEEESWGLMWDERYKGRLATFGSIDETVPYAAIYAGIDPYNMSPAEMETVRKLLQKQRPLIRFYASDNTSIEQALASGEIVAGSTWNGSVATLKAQGLPVAFLNPKEGIMTWVCGLVIHKDAPNLDKAHDLIDSMLSVEAGIEMLNVIGYGHANARAFEKVSDETLEAVGLGRDAEAFLKKGIFSRQFKDRDAVTAMFEEVKAGM